jgi:flagellin-like hook-associated protein FlgL
VGSTIAGNVDFDNFTIRSPNSTAPCIVCHACANCGSTIPAAEMQVDISGLGDGVIGCACSSFNGTYVLQLIGQPQPFDTFTGCKWLYELPSPLCSNNYLTLQPVSSNAWLVTFADLLDGDADDDSYIRFIVTSPGTNDCATVSGLTGTGATTYTAAGQMCSNEATATATITAL